MEKTPASMVGNWFRKLPVEPTNQTFSGDSAGDLFAMVRRDLLERLLVTSNDRG